VDAERGRPLAGAAVQVGGVEGGVLSDTDGRFVLRPLPPGTCTIVTRVDGTRLNNSFNPRVRQFAFGRAEHRLAARWLGTLTVTGAWVRSRERPRAGSPVLVVEQDTVNTAAVTAEFRSAC
jgi:hypothetical protein